MIGDYNQHKAEITPLIFEKNVIFKKTEKNNRKKPSRDKKSKKGFCLRSEATLFESPNLMDFT